MDLQPNSERCSAASDEPLWDIAAGFFWLPSPTLGLYCDMRVHVRSSAPLRPQSKDALRILMISLFTRRIAPLTGSGQTGVCSAMVSVSVLKILMLTFGINFSAITHFMNPIRLLHERDAGNRIRLILQSRQPQSLVSAALLHRGGVVHFPGPGLMARKSTGQSLFIVIALFSLNRCILLSVPTQRHRCHCTGAIFAGFTA